MTFNQSFSSRLDIFTTVTTRKNKEGGIKRKNGKCGEENIDKDELERCSLIWA